MAQSKAAAQTYPINLRVTNRSKRTRVRNGVTFPGKADGKTTTVDVEVADLAGWLRVNACQDLKVAVAKGSGGKAQGDSLEQLNVEQLRERLTEADLPVTGNKDELVARLREHDEAS